MSQVDEILNLEKEIKEIFKKDVITKADVRVSNQLLGRWKYLTKYTPDNTPALKTENNENSKR